MNRTPNRTLLAIGAALILLLTGCGSDDDGGGGGDGVASANGGQQAASTGTDSAGRSRDEQNLEFAQCLRDNGLDVEDPEPGGGVRLNEDEGPTFDKAMDACRELAPAAPSDLDPEQVQRETLEFTRCMRENGVAVPDPQPGHGPEIGAEQLADPDYEQAMETCAGPGMVADNGAGK